MGRHNGFKHSNESKRKCSNSQIINSLLKKGIIKPDFERNLYVMNEENEWFIIPRLGDNVHC